MNLSTRTPVIALAAAGLITGSGLALTALPATAATTTHSSSRLVQAPTHGAKALSSSRLAQVRERQRRMAAQHRAAPVFAKAGSTTFTVDTTNDTSLATPTDTHCVDAAAHCSLRAAVEAANNLGTPVRIVLAATTYTLSSAAPLTATDAAGISIVGRGSGQTAIAGAGSNLLFLTAAGTALPSATVWLTSLKLENGTAPRGGAIRLDDTYSGATVVLDHVVATGNSATEYGGALYLSYGTSYIRHSSFTHNLAPTGGALYQYWSDLNITNSRFEHNSSTPGSPGSGGAIADSYGIFDMTGGSISHNTAGDVTQSSFGGGIYDTYGFETLTNVHLDGNSAGSAGTADGDGGAYYGYQTFLEVNGGTMSDNHAYAGISGYGSGGAIYASFGNQTLLHGVTLNGNQADGASDGYGGGAIYTYGSGYPSQLLVDHSTITGSNNAAVYLYSSNAGVDASIVGSTLSGNSDLSGNGYSSLGCGGAVCAYAYEGAVNLHMRGDNVAHNSSAGNYGGGAVTGYAASIAGLSMALSHSTFVGNHTGGGGYGGAVGLYNGNSDTSISLRMSADTFRANRAGTQSDEGWGGAIGAYYGAQIADVGSTFSHNRAIGDGAWGGAVGLNTGYSSSAWTRTRFLANSAGTNQEGNAGYGGAVYSDNEAGDSFRQVTMSDNAAASQGGGFYGGQYAYMPLFRSSTISGNTAGTSTVAGQGGGIWAGAAVITVENSTLTHNRARSVTGTPGQGGGIWYAGSRLGVRYSTLSKNYAQQGGGIFSSAYGGSLLSSIVSANRTSPTGTESDCAVGSAASQVGSLGGNVLGQKLCVPGLAPGDRVTTKPGLKKLADNGGPTQTMALKPSSKAIGRATFQIPAVDQRGHARPANHADAGAYELPKKH